MTAPVLDAEPACPGGPEAPTPSADLSASATAMAAATTASAATATTPTPGTTAPLRAERRSIDLIARETWDALAAATPWATPFSQWPFHRAWWDAYGANAHEETLCVCDATGDVVAIVPLMHRHEVEPEDAALATKLRHTGDLTHVRVDPTAKAVFMGASYHADYATILAEPAALPGVAAAVADYLASDASGPWDVADLRRLRCGDPAADALTEAARSRAGTTGWSVQVEREDVCPVVTLPVGATMDDYLATLGKKERHEIRRKVRRAEAVGEITLTDSTDPLADLDDFIDLHQRRWGADGLFPPTEGGAQSRVLFRRLFELFGADGPLRLAFLSVGGRRIAAGVHFETEDGVLYYNAGVDPEARELSPGVVMVYAYVGRALAEGRHRLDFLRGDEPYKYEWGAVDEPIQRVLIRRMGQ